VTDNKRKTLINFKKAQSHIARIIKMMEQDEYCINIMQQNLAVIGLLRSAHLKLMENHLKTCFKKAIDADDQERKQAMIQEILTVTKLFNK
jgi:DNA-binding FrmR family transcriptional regulator